MVEVQQERVWWNVAGGNYGSEADARAAAWSQGVPFVDCKRRVALVCGWRIEVADWIAVVDLRGDGQLAAPRQVCRVRGQTASVRGGVRPYSWRTAVDARGVVRPAMFVTEPCGLFSGRFVGIAGSVVRQVEERAGLILDLHRAGELL